MKRMFEMDRRAFVGGALALAADGCKSWLGGVDPNVSVFSVYIKWAARKHGIDESEIAARMLAAGVTGIDVDCEEGDRIARLADCGMTVVSMYGFVHFLEPEKAKRESDAMIAAALKYKSPRLMVIPDNLPDQGDKDRALARIATGLADLTARAKREGLETTIEDFGSAKSSCSRIRYMETLFAASPDLGFTIDTGNLFYVNGGDDILEAFACFRNRIRHVHVKDCLDSGNPRYAPLGAGCIPNEKIVKTLVREGYRGWYTLEEHGAEDIAEATYAAADVLRRWA